MRRIRQLFGRMVPEATGGTGAGASTPTPTVTGISPTIGSTLGSDSVVITGTALTGATAVKFGATNAASFVVNSGIQITAVSPAHTAGVVDITVTTPGGTSVTGAADQFTYAVPAATIYTSSVVIADLSSFNCVGGTLSLVNGGTGVSVDTPLLVTELDVSQLINATGGAFNLSSLTGLLEFTTLNNPVTVTGIPASVLSLTLNSVTNFVTFNATGYLALQTLSLQSAVGLHAVTNLPSTLTSLDISYTTVTAMPTTPAGCTTLILAGITTITPGALALGGRAMASLDISYSTSFTSVTGLNVADGATITADSSALTNAAVNATLLVYANGATAGGTSYVITLTGFTLDVTGLARATTITTLPTPGANSVTADNFP